jgi:hypothetical protein
VSCAWWSTPDLVKLAPMISADARPRAVLIVWPVGRRGTLPGRRDVIPLATELVVSNQDERLLAVGPSRMDFEQVDQMAITVCRCWRSRVLVLFADRLDERDGRQCAASCGGDELGFVRRCVRPGMPGA